MAVKTKEEARANFEASTAQIGPRYQAGIRRADWKTAAASDQAEANYADVMSRVISERRRQSGIQSVSNEEWRNQAINKGGAVIGQRVRDSLDKWSAKFGPIYDQVVSTVSSLPPRTTDFRQNVQARVIPVIEAWKRASGKI